MSQGQISTRPRVLYVAYPLLTVSEESAGGAEQVLGTLERELSQRGIASTVAASAGSSVAGELVATGDPCRVLDDFDRRNHDHQQEIIALVRRRARQGRPFDLVHDMSGSLWTRASEIDVPVLATLHLPRDFYPPGAFANIPPNVAFNCVSRAQAANFQDVSVAVAVIGNGIELAGFGPHVHAEDRTGLMWLGRICEEKAPHVALEIAGKAHLPVILAGQTYPFSYHRRYFENEVAPRLTALPDARFVDAPSLSEKCRLLRHSQALLITSQAEETSSLVAMEAAASGTPVIAFRRGALPEIVREGVTGFLVDGVEDAVQALGRVGQISPASCARYAREHFSAGVMAETYMRLYTRLLNGDRGATGAIPNPCPSAA